MSITTKTGDSGYTSLNSTWRVKKSTRTFPLVLNGKLDQLNALLGCVRGPIDEKDRSIVFQLHTELLHIQKTLIKVAGSVSVDRNIDLKNETDELEESIRQMENDKFIPVKFEGIETFCGTKWVTGLQFARTVCREAELVAWDYVWEERMDSSIPQYLNRLSDWLYIRAKYFENQEELG